MNMIKTTANLATLAIACVVIPAMASDTFLTTPRQEVYAVDLQAQERGGGSQSAGQPRLEQRSDTPAMDRRKDMEMQRRGPDAGSPRGRRMPEFNDYDLNGDGIVGEQEFGEARKSRVEERMREERRMRNQADAPPFSEIDNDGDGVITREEFIRHQETNRKKWEEQG